MPLLGKFNLLDKDTRLIKYNNRVYKVKLQYRTHQGIADDTVPCNQDDIQSEMEAAIRAVLAMQGDLHSFRTKHFLIHPERKFWNTSSLLKFFEHGHELTGDPHMLCLVVENIQDHSRETDQVGRTLKDDANAKDKHEENDSQRAGPSSRGRKETRTTASASQDSRRLRKRRKTSQQPEQETDDSENTSDVNSPSDHDRPRFHSPPHKHRRYALRKRATSNPPATNREGQRGRPIRKPYEGPRRRSRRKRKPALLPAAFPR
ncbi:uncharacterized protein [Amphiura filiformis]|uniref:uncharacterized protein n=1 Tax=Amphiura filiformis TaxID=82378 RepID=UPI003B222E33